MRKPITIVEAPLSVGVGLSGVERLPAALAETGLAQAIGAAGTKSAGRPSSITTVDRETGIPDPTRIRAFLLRLADMVSAEIAAGALPLVVGGDCTVLLGCLAGARRHGSRGLLFIDGHTDFNKPGYPDCETASMDLALATGHGPSILTELDGPAPLVRAGDVAVFGFRDESEIAAAGGMVADDPDLLLLPLSEIRTRGFGNAAARSLERLARLEAPFWIHLDVDALDDAVFHAVDYRIPDGLSIGEVVGLLKRALVTGKVAGIDVTILNPDLDWDGSQARLLVALLQAALAA